MSKTISDVVVADRDLSPAAKQLLGKEMKEKRLEAQLFRRRWRLFGILILLEGRGPHLRCPSPGVWRSEPFANQDAKQNLLIFTESEQLKRQRMNV
jgi:hypothetical protein